jgi:hypothetical protein
MEHPFLVEEYIPAHAQRAPDAAREFGTAMARLHSTAPSHLANVANVYTAMRPYLPGAAYVNYCDLDLQNFADAYCGANLPRLSAVKTAYDPDNLFHHAQSVPPVRSARPRGKMLRGRWTVCFRGRISHHCADA